VTRYRQALWFALLVVPFSAANSADMYHNAAMPAAGAAGRFSGPALDAGQLVTGGSKGKDVRDSSGRL